MDWTALARLPVRMPAIARCDTHVHAWSSRTDRVCALVVVPQYVVLVLITFLTQVAIGAYLLNLDMSSLRTSWEQDDQEGAARRNQLQQYMECCGYEPMDMAQGAWTGQGQRRRPPEHVVSSFVHVFSCLPLVPVLCSFDIWSDSIGTLHTDCPYLPKYPQYIEPTSCKQAAEDFVDSWLKPIATAAIVIGCIEVRTLGRIARNGTAWMGWRGRTRRSGQRGAQKAARPMLMAGSGVLTPVRPICCVGLLFCRAHQSLAMAITFTLILKSKDQNSDTAFDY